MRIDPDGTVTVVSDLPTTIITVTTNGRSKRVESYIGAPDSVAALQREIDEAATRARFEAFVASWERRVDEEAARLRAIGARLVLGDVPPMAW